MEVVKYVTQEVTVPVEKIVKEYVEIPVEKIVTKEVRCNTVPRV